MAYEDLRAFIAALEQRGLLRRIKTEVDPILEVTEITDRVSKRLGPALLFERVKGSPMPLLINAFGSEAHLCLALQRASLDELAGELDGILEIKSPEGWLEKLKMLPKLTEMASYLPKRVKDGPCKEVRITQEPSFDLLPVIKCWPLDGGRFITFPLVFTKDPDTGTRNCGMYRMQIYDERTAGMHWHIHHGGARHYEKNRRLGRRTEVAVAIGPDPATTLSAVIPAPDGIDEMLIAGFLRKRSVELVPCETVDLEVPANAEIVLEGYVEPDELRLEGPFGDHTGFYSSPTITPSFI